MPSAHRPEDEWLALRCQRGEPEAFRELVGTLESPLMYLATKLLGSERDAPDIVQEVWLQAFAKIRKLKDPAALRPWLYQIARSLCASRQRSSAARRQREESVAREEPPTGEDPGELQLRKEDAAAVHAALDELSVEHREVLTLGLLEDFSLEEMALIVQVPVGTIKSRLFHAKRRLRHTLEAAREGVSHAG
jgi:RNA polymerase sigma-70 factor (ECF subfamily)